MYTYGQAIILAKKFIDVTKDEGIFAAFAKARNKIIGKANTTSLQYDVWIKKFDTLTDNDRVAIKKAITDMKYKPLISIVMPVYNTQLQYLEEAINSVTNQLYTNWELCIADDASPKSEIRDLLKSFQEKDARIKVVYRSKNGNISASSNSALELATGEYIAFMDHDDLLAEQALFMVALEINQVGNKVDLIYTDEDKIDDNDHRYDPYFKNDWNPKLFFSQNYIAHLGVYRANIVKKIGGFRIGYEGSQDYDLILRFLPYTLPERIRHIPHILYHWRIFAGNHTFSTDNMNISDSSAYKAISDYFTNANESVAILPVKQFPGCWYIKKILPDNQEKVSIIIPTKDKALILKRCIDSIINKTTYSNYEIIIIDNNSEEQETFNYFDSIKSNKNISVFRVEEAFNYSRLNNLAANKAQGQILLFLNNDTEVIASDWLEHMLQSLAKKDVGIVGGKLYYGNNTIQHAGVTLGIYGIASHICRHQPRQATGYFGQLMLERNVSAVTGACLMIKRAVFEEIGGFDEKFLKVSYNDVDLCLKVRNKGYQIVLNPYAELYHYESLSRGADENKQQKDLNRFERRIMYKRYGSSLMHDPFYNPNLTLDNENCVLAEMPRDGKPWYNRIEFICPFHRGDVLLGIQVANYAYLAGKNVRMHVSEQLIEWIKSFKLPFPVEAIPVGIPKPRDTYAFFSQAEDYVSNRSDFSGIMIGSHPKLDLDILGLNIMENMIVNFQLPLETKIFNCPIKFVARNTNLSLDVKNILNEKNVLIHPWGGWDLKSIPSEIVQKVITIMHKMGYKVIQIGGKNDKKIINCDAWILENYNLDTWDTIFGKTNIVISADSWTSHFAAILDKPQIVFYGPTNARDVNCKCNFNKQNNKVLLFNTIAECAPCNVFKCVKTKGHCLGFNIDEKEIKDYCNQY